MIPTARLPILAIVENVLPDPIRGWASPVFTLLDAPLRAIVETGYDRDQSPGEAQPMSLIRLKPITDVLTIGYSVGVGIDNAAAEVTGDPSFRPLGTVKPAVNGYGVTEIKLSTLLGKSEPNPYGGTVQSAQEDPDAAPSAVAIQPVSTTEKLRQVAAEQPGPVAQSGSAKSYVVEQPDAVEQELSQPAGEDEQPPARPEQPRRSSLRDGAGPRGVLHQLGRNGDEAQRPRREMQRNADRDEVPADKPAAASESPARTERVDTRPSWRPQRPGQGAERQQDRADTRGDGDRGERRAHGPRRAAA